ncbi:hypothetical protein [Bacillus sp. FJAT-42376]|uniref:hypothetical protein n=1 Tax=Bacillus sp. FJAT-42376 TaxID=2014076 RepID=UPI0013DDB2A8|nr:hypothetical protein [Bacillus sp. FJAT-42376]
MMGRGEHFNHKQKGHKPEQPAYGKDVPAKQHEATGYAIETTASADHGPVQVISEK